MKYAFVQLYTASGKPFNRNGGQKLLDGRLSPSKLETAARAWCRAMRRTNPDISGFSIGACVGAQWSGTAISEFQSI